MVRQKKEAEAKIEPLRKLPMPAPAIFKPEEIAERITKAARESAIKEEIERMLEEEKREKPKSTVKAERAKEKNEKKKVKKEKKSIDFAAIERKWQQTWARARAFESKEKKGKKKFYCLEMFPYPSGRLHMGHVRNYCIGDCIARFKRAQGFNVLYPMGFDSLGLPAENAAIQRGIAPDKWTIKNIEDMKTDLVALGFSYDWSREIRTMDSSYYKWEQLFFLRMLKAGLVYKKRALVNYCPKCQTVLANEQVHEGKCWRCETEIEFQEREQWFFNQRKYAFQLLNYKSLDWPGQVKTMQENWIGKSQGIKIVFEIKDTKERIPVFTTRADTICGATAIVLAPEHQLVKDWIKGTKYEDDFLNFLKEVQSKGITERTSKETEKKGMFIGKFAINPVTEEELPVYIGNFVIPEYGAGAVMAVPAHDQRDFEFAKKYDLPIKIVIQPKDKKLESLSQAYTDYGILVNSKQFSGMSSERAIEAIAKFLKKERKGKKAVEYKLKDWLISRQRYWGTPIPIVYCKKCGIVPVSESELPVKLPDSTKVVFGKGNPLETCGEFVNTNCPCCKGKAKRETDTMDTFVDSSWYFLRYCDPKNNKAAFDKKKIACWMPVDLYIGGIEHACMHLIYARFFCKALADLGFVPKKLREPFKRVLCQGMVLKDGVAMSKSRGNVVTCQEMLEKYGADTIRLFELSSALPTSDLEFTERGIEGSYRFLLKLYSLPKTEKAKNKIKAIEDYLVNEKEVLVKEVTQELGALRFNIALTKIFSFVDIFIAYKKFISIKAAREIIKSLTLLIAPFTPHLAEEIWHKLGNKGFVFSAPWPKVKKISKEALKAGQLLESTIDDIKNILKIIKKKPQAIYLYCMPKEKSLFKQLKEAMTNLLNIPLTVYSSKEAKYDPQSKASKARPGKPALYVD